MRSWIAFMKRVAAGECRDPYDEFAHHYARLVAEEMRARETRAMQHASDHIHALLDLARTHREQDFRDLAAMVGVQPDQLDALWAGTRRRVGLDP